MAGLSRVSVPNTPNLQLHFKSDLALILLKKLLGRNEDGTETN